MPVTMPEGGSETPTVTRLGNRKRLNLREKESGVGLKIRRCLVVRCELPIPSCSLNN